ncbi:MAG: hypothetical protein ACPGQV_04985 [Alphaproteobacteria bacterium]
MADIGHRIATELVDEEKSDRARLFERLAQFLCLERGVGGDQYEPRQGTGTFHQHPFRGIRRPDNYVFAGFEPRRECQRQSFTFREQCALASAPSKLPIQLHFDQGFLAWIFGCNLLQQAPDGGLPNGVVGLRGEVSFGQAL